MIKFIQTTYYQNRFSFVDLFIACQNHDNYQIPYVVVDNEYVEQSLENAVTDLVGISSYKFYRSLNTLFNELYLSVYPDHILFNPVDLQYLIYNYLIATKFGDFDSDELLSYVGTDINTVNVDRIFYFAQHVQNIFIDYLYYRTEELIAIEDGQAPALFPDWQIKLWQYIRRRLLGKKLFTDIYRYFRSDNIMGSDLIIYVCNINKIYPAHLKILNQLSKNIEIYWLYQSISDLYYGDIMPFALQQKYLSKKQSVQNLEELYLDNINPLVANMALQSREFIELLLVHNIAINIVDDNFYLQQGLQPELDLQQAQPTLLKLLQHDIAQLIYRASDYDNKPHLDLIKLTKEGKYYDHIDSCGRELMSVEIHQCLSPVQELEIVADKILYLMNSNAGFKLTDFVIAAPKIQDYKAYIQHVFELKAKGTKIPYALAKVSEKFAGYQQGLELLDDLLSLPSQLTALVVLDILRNEFLMQHYDLAYDQVLLIEKWLLDNNTLFGNDDQDYTDLGYLNYGSNSFGNLKKKLVLGNFIATKQVDYSLMDYHCYDIELESELLEKLITIVEALEWLINKLYDSSNQSYRLLNNRAVLEIIKYIEACFLPANPVIPLIENIFTNIYLEDINCEILKKIIVNQYPITNLYLNAGVSCISLTDLATVKAKAIFLIGLNDKDFPRPKSDHYLSILSKSWKLSDRNNNLDDKQHFLQAILLAQNYLSMSFVASPDHTNPSSVLKLVINVVADSVGGNILQKHHQILYNYDYQYSYYPLTIKEEITAESINIDSSKLQSPEIRLNDFIATFLYTNSNLYKARGLQHYMPHSGLVSDIEFVDISNPKISKRIFQIFDQHFTTSSYDELYEYCYQLGMLNPNRNFSSIQFKEVYDSYLPPVRKDYSIELTQQHLEQDYYIYGDIAIINNRILLQPLSGALHYPYQQLVTAIVIASLLTAGAIVKSKNQKTGEKIVIDSSTLDYIEMSNGENSIFFEVKSSAGLLLPLLEYYHYSQYNPVMIQQKTIEQGIIHLYNYYNATLKSTQAKEVKTLRAIFKQSNTIRSCYQLARDHDILLALVKIFAIMV